MKVYIKPYSLADLFSVGRRRNRLTLKQVERATGISNSQVSLIENGQRNTSFSNIIKLCDLYRIDIREAVAAERRKHD